MNKAYERNGFSLLEIVAVLAITATIAGALLVSWSGETERARLVSAARQWCLWDSQTRTHSIGPSQSGWIKIDLDQQTVEMTRISAVKPGVMTRRFSAFVTIDLVTIEDRQVRRGTAWIPVDPRGATPSYALRLVAGQTRARITVAGGTGQTEVTIDEPDARD